MDFLTVCYCCDKIGACFPKGEEEEAGGRVGRHNRMGGGGEGGGGGENGGGLRANRLHDPLSYSLPPVFLFFFSFVQIKINIALGCSL